MRQNANKHIDSTCYSTEYYVKIETQLISLVNSGTYAAAS